jgi:AcrR family transcriptional regulator
MKVRQLPPPVPSLQERKQRLVRAELAELAVGPLLERGFNAVTIDDLAKAAGISRRTFFRYFETKEDVVTCAFDEAGDELVRVFRERPTDELPLVSLRTAIVQVIHGFARDPARARALMRLIRDTDALRARFLIRQDDWREQLTAAITERMPKDPKTPMLARLIATVSMGTVDAAMTAWAESNARELDAVADEAFAALDVIVLSASRGLTKRRS